MLQYRETHNRHTSALTTKNTQIQTHVHSRDTFKYRVAHTNRDSQTQTGTHTRNTRARCNGGRETAVPPGRSRPAQRLQTLRSSRPTDSHKQFDNHSPRSHSTSTRPAPGHRGGRVAPKPPPRLLRTDNLSRLAGSAREAASAAANKAPGPRGPPRGVRAPPAGGHPPLVSRTAMAQSSSCSQMKM